MFSCEIVSEIELNFYHLFLPVLCLCTHINAVTEIYINKLIYENLSLASFFLAGVCFLIYQLL